MLREVLYAKIHRATVTEANIDYIGSITLDPILMEKSGLRDYDKVAVLDINNGVRLETYVIPGERGTGVVCMNGAAARLIQKGDLVIILSYWFVSENETITPKIVHVDSKNQPIE